MKVPLLEYLDKLEATARCSILAPCGGIWKIERDGESGIVAVVCPNEDANPVAESISAWDAEHIVAAQPRATLALIAKLREAIRLAGELASDAADGGFGRHLLREILQIEVTE